MLSWRSVSSRHPATCVHHSNCIQLAHPSSGSSSVMHGICGMLVLGSYVLWLSSSMPVARLLDVKSVLFQRWMRIALGSVL